MDRGAVFRAPYLTSAATPRGEKDDDTGTTSFNEAATTRKHIMTFVIVIWAGKQPRSFRWCIRTGVNQPNACGPSRAEPGPAGCRRAAERVFGPLTWIDAAEAGADERNGYVVQVAKVEVVNAPA